MVNYAGYLKNTGTQYIDTGYKPTNNTRVVCKVSGFPCTAYSQAVFGTRTSGSASDRFGFIAAQDTSSYRSDFYGNNIAFASSVNYDGEFIIDKHGATTTLNETDTASNTSGSFTAAYPLFIFGYNTGGSLSNVATNLSLFYFKIYESDVLVHDYWPCCDPDGVACLYDRVDRVYLYNAGSGEFTAGNDDGGEEEIVYRTLIITQTGDVKGYATVTIGGISYNSGTTLTVKDGTEITLRVSSSGTGDKKIIVNNTTVSASTYSLAVTSNYTILLSNLEDDSGNYYGQVMALAA